MSMLNSLLLISLLSTYVAGYVLLPVGGDSSSSESSSGSSSSSSSSSSEEGDQSGCLFCGFHTYCQNGKCYCKKGYTGIPTSYLGCSDCMSFNKIGTSEWVKIDSSGSSSSDESSSSSNESSGSSSGSSGSSGGSSGSSSGSSGSSSGSNSRSGSNGDSDDSNNSSGSSENDSSSESNEECYCGPLTYCLNGRCYCKKGCIGNPLIGCHYTGK